MSQHIELGDISIPVGCYEKDGKTKKRYRRIGTLMQTTFDDGGKNLWLRVNGDALSSSLLILTRPLMEKGADSVICNVFEKRADGAAKPATATAGEDDVPF